MKHLLLLSVLFLASCSTTDKPKKIRVSGEGKVRVMPNQVTLTLDVSFTQPRMVDAVRKTQETVDSVILILEKFGKKDLDIKTSSISANKDYEYTGNTNKFMGYQAQQTIDFVLNDISKFTELTGKLLETKINSISHIQFSHSKADSLFREADLLAYDDALKSANKLTTRASVKLGKLLFLSNDNSTNDNDGYYSGDRINTYNKGYGGRGFKISPEVIEFKRNITTEFEISN
ncbi:MAG: SIMPL domain-containing protein [Bacteroidetes bacterium]|nr:SIMPL domain-containing protein [Bacteroidota bacterium]